MSAHIPRSARGSFDRPRNPRTTTMMRMPEKLKAGDDAAEDVTAPKTKAQGVADVNESFMSIVAKAASSSKQGPHGDSKARMAPGWKDPKPKLLVRWKGSFFDDSSDTETLPVAVQQRRAISQSLPGLKKSAPGVGRSRMMAKMSASQILSMPEPGFLFAPFDDIYDEYDSEEDKSNETGNKHTDHEESTGMDDLVDQGDMQEPQEEADEEPGLGLDEQLAQMFAFPEVEKVIAEYPCGLLQNILLQGFLYLTERHICFYSYLAESTNKVLKSGFLFKRGRKNPAYQRLWFILKNDTFSYYSNPSNVYFPSGSVELRSGVVAELAPPQGKGKDQDAVGFTITTHQRTYFFRAESTVSAREWVKQIQKVIFRAHNGSDAVKIVLPISNVLDIEENVVANFAKMAKIRIFDNSETYAIDEYFFSFLDSSTDALSVLRDVVENNAMHKVNQSIFQETQSSTGDVVEQSGDVALNFPSGDESRGTEKIRRQSKSNDMPSGSPRASDYLTHLEGGGARKAAAQRLLDAHSNPRSRPQSVHGEPSAKEALEDVSGAPSRQSIDAMAVSPSEPLQRGDVSERSTIRHIRGVSLETLRKPKADSARSLDVQAPVVRASGLDMIQALASASQTNIALPDLDYAKRSLTPGANERPTSVRNSSTSTLHELVRAGSYPLQKASGLAGLLKIQSLRMGSLLANESKEYYGKVMSMWTGETTHYDEFEGRVEDEDLNEDKEDAQRGSQHGERFRAHFTLPPTEKLQATYYGYLQRLLPIYGKVYIGDTKFCFRSLLPGIKTKMILPLQDIENIQQQKGQRWAYHGMIVVIRGHEELFFEFSKREARDDCAITLLRAVSSVDLVEEPLSRSPEQDARSQASKAESKGFERARRNNPDSASSSRRGSADHVPGQSRIVFDDSDALILDFTPTRSMRITCLTIGSRGDVQPYIALCKELLAQGHRPTIATHQEFESWITGYGIEFAPVAGNPAEIMRLCVENDMFTFGFLIEASTKFRGWIDDLFLSSWYACQGSDLIIESPSAMGGIHIAEALQIPYFRAFTMPWTQTRSYPHAFTVPSEKMGGNYNSLTYVFFETVFWQATAGQINRWRERTLGIPATSLSELQLTQVPFLYNFSPQVVPQPLDFPYWIRTTGYWFLDEGDSYEPPKELTDFIAKARADGKKLVYIGFGSVVVEDSNLLTEVIVQSVLKAEVRCVLNKGWSDRLEVRSTAERERARTPLPADIFLIKSAPHDWLFRQMDATVHHGGAGTTGASLRAGIPTVIKPFFGDQFFFGQRVVDLGVGECLGKFMNTSVLSQALWRITNSERMIVQARELGKEIRKENGVKVAIKTIYRDLDHANSLIKRRGTPRNAMPREEAMRKLRVMMSPVDDESEHWELIYDDRTDREDANNGELLQSGSFFRPGRRPSYEGAADEEEEGEAEEGEGASSREE